MVKCTDGVQYFRPRVKYLRSLPARDLHHLAQLNLNNNNNNVGSIRGLITVLEAESRNSKWKRFKPMVGRAIKSKDKFTSKQVLKMVYKQARCMRKIPIFAGLILIKFKDSVIGILMERRVKRLSNSSDFGSGLVS
ncbi:hypothetical protein Hanom_Chr09g00797511 [Helianthus anomalus]